MVEQRFLDAKSVSDVIGLDSTPQELPIELQQADRQALDRTVLEALGIPVREVDDWLNRIYKEVTHFWNEARIIELHAIENRRRSKKGYETSAAKVAQEIFASFLPGTRRIFPDEFLPDDEPLETVELLEGKATLYDANDLYDSNAIAIGQSKKTLRHRAQAELAKLYVDLHHFGFVRLPVSAKGCDRMRLGWERYMAEMQETFKALAVERTEDEDRQDLIIGELNRLWVKFP